MIYGSEVSDRFDLDSGEMGAAVRREDKMSPHKCTLQYFRYILRIISIYAIQTTELQYCNVP